MNKQPKLPFWSPMARGTDPQTSHDTAAAIRPELGKIQRLVLDVYAERGPMTARAAERLPEFAAYGFSTIRKRISELHQARLLVEAGVDTTRRAPATIYTVATDPIDSSSGAEASIEGA